jgi:hypothetical protein
MVNVEDFKALLKKRLDYEALFNEKTPLCKIINDPKINTIHSIINNVEVR